MPKASRLIATCTRRFNPIYPFLHKLVLPAGVVDLSTNRPPADVVLLARRPVCRAPRTCIQPCRPFARCSRPIHSQLEFSRRQDNSLLRINRSSAEWRSTPFLQIRTTISARIPSVWIATLVEKTLVVLIHCSAAIPSVQVVAADVRLDDATEDQAANDESGRSRAIWRLRDHSSTLTLEYETGSD